MSRTHIAAGYSFYLLFPTMKAAALFAFHCLDQTTASVVSLKKTKRAKPAAMLQYAPFCPRREELFLLRVSEIKIKGCRKSNPRSRTVSKMHTQKRIVNLNPSTSPKLLLLQETILGNDKAKYLCPIGMKKKIS